jgi:transposase
MKIRFVGLDVHKASIVIAVAEEGSGAPEVLGREPNDIPHLVKKLKALRGNGVVKCAYEAGPTGVGLSRALKKAGIECLVVAPSRVPDTHQGRMKTDGRDAIRLARFLRSGDLTPIHVPDARTEAMRDLSRCREDALAAKQAARQQLGGLMLRHDRRYAGKKQGTKSHLTWLKAQAFEHEAQRRVLSDYIAAYEAAATREAKLVKDMAELLPQWELAPIVRALMALRGVDLVSAFTLVAEIGDFGRFARAPEFASFTGATPSERSSGEREVRGSITKAGNSHVRRILVEASWNYRFPRMSNAILARGQDVPPEVKTIVQKAQDRLYRRQRTLLARGKEKNKVAIAVARELACFVWSIANAPSVQQQVLKQKQALQNAA